VVPRAWTHLLAEVTGDRVEGVTPEDWRAAASERGGERAPASLDDGRSAEFVAFDGVGDGSAIDRAIAATRRASFPLLGLDPVATA
jgi:acetoin utilization protein AcuC